MYDAIIAGAGPGGASAAKFLAERGLSCLILDKAGFPRDKCCGGALTPRTLEKFPFLEPFVETVCRKGYIHGSRPGESFPITGENVIAYYTRRIALDAGLVDLARSAGATVRERFKIRKVETLPDRVRVVGDPGEFEGRFLIGADGVQSVVRREVGLERHWHKKNLGFIYQAEVEVGRETIERFYGPDCVAHIQFLFGGVLGYGWVFPKARHINLGLGGFLQEFTPARLRELFGEYMRHCFQTGRCPEIEIPEPKGWVLHMTGPIREFTAHRTLLVGDAAGFSHPISGEGILYAIWSARIAADALAECFADGDAKPEKAAALYRKRCLAEFGDELKTIGKYPRHVGRALHIVMRIARRDEALVKILFRLSDGKMSFREAKWKMLRRVLWGLATGKALSASNP